MQAIILAAGMGKRLGPLTEHNTKCMIKVNGISLIDRVLSQLSSLSLTRIILVIGYEGEKLKNYIGHQYKGVEIDYIENPIFDKTNNIYSLYLAKEKLQEDDTLLLESDLIFEDSLFHKILANPYSNLAMVARYETWMDGTMVQLNEHFDIINFISKKNFRYDEIDTYYKTVNLYKFSKEFLRTSYVPFLEAYSKALGNNEYYEQVLRVITLLDKCELKALPLSEEKWYEIDDLQDLDIAETIFAGDNQLELYQKRYGGYWRFPSLKDFCYLVNPYFPPVKMREEIKSNFDALLTEYPSGMFVNSLLMAKNFSVKQEYVAVGNGAAELIKSLMNRLEGNIGTVYPTFEEYPHRKQPENLLPFIPQNPDFSYSALDLQVFYEEKNIKSLIVINPDNPSGNFIPREELLGLVEWAKKKTIFLIVDESFVDFSTLSYHNTLLSNHILEKYPNLIVVKSISKSYGVPGLRLGLVACSDVTVLSSLKKDVTIWNINSFAEFYLQIYGKYANDYKKACALFLAERERFYNELHQIGFLRIIPSQANYFLCELISKYTSKELTLILLKKYNILIKDCSSKKGFNGKNYIRIAVRNKEDNDILIHALNKLK